MGKLLDFSKINDIVMELDGFSGILILANFCDSQVLVLLETAHISSSKVETVVWIEIRCGD